MKSIVANQTRKEAELISEYEERVEYIRNNLDHKEFLLQYKETKWAELDKLLVQYLETDDFLISKIDEIKYTVIPDLKITNVVKQNERLTKLVKKKSSEIDQLKGYLVQLGIDKKK